MKFSLHPKMPTTVKEMMELFPYITTKQAKRLDWKIKLRIAWDDREEKMLSYVKLVLKPIQKSNHTFNPHCEILAKAYLENNKRLICNENLFNFLGLIASVILLLMELLFMRFPCEFLEAIFEPFIIYLGTLILFSVMIHKGWAYKNEVLKEYLTLLSRSSASLSFVSTACFCVLISSGDNSIFTIISLIICALLPCCAIIKAFVQLKQKPENR